MNIKGKVEILKKSFFSGIGRRFWAYASLLLLVSDLLIIGGVLFVAMKNENNNLTERYVNKTENIYYNFDGIFQNLDTMTEDLIINSYIQKSLTDQELSGYDYEMIQKTLFYLDDDYVSYGYYFDNQDNVYTQKSLNLKKKDIQNMEIASYLEESYARTVLIRMDTSALGIEGEHFVVGRYVRHLTQSEEPGILLLVLKDSLFGNIADAAQGEKPYYYIIDKSGSRCYWINGKEEDASVSLEDKIKSCIKEKPEEEAFVTDISEGILCCRRHETTGFVLVSFVPKSILNQVQYRIVGIVLTIAVVVLLITAVVAGYFSHRLSSPIRKISERMMYFNRESLSIPLDIHTNTELDDISNAYNKMLTQIDHLLNQIKTQQIELKNVEMESLLYQIHPHFLYNTLGNIYMLARLSEEETIMQMIDALSKFLRLTLSNGEETLTVEKELEHVCAYMEILKIRKDNMFHYNIECAEEVKKLPVLKLILQPLAENAIKHGFAAYDEGGQIDVSVKQEDGYLHCTIHDNGEGIPEEVLKQINGMQQQAFKEERRRKSGIGIYNVVYRLKLKYGKDVCFWYESNPGSTTGHITIAVKALKEE